MNYKETKETCSNRQSKVLRNWSKRDQKERERPGEDEPLKMRGGKGGNRLRLKVNALLFPMGKASVERTGGGIHSSARRDAEQSDDEKKAENFNGAEKDDIK